MDISEWVRSVTFDCKVFYPEPPGKSSRFLTAPANENWTFCFSRTKHEFSQLTPTDTNWTSVAVGCSWTFVGRSRDRVYPSPYLCMKVCHTILWTYPRPLVTHTHTHPHTSWQRKTHTEESLQFEMSSCWWAFQWQMMSGVLECWLWSTQLGWCHLFHLFLCWFSQVAQTE